ncbi:MAG: hypothetical protein AB7Q17_06130 [Phycisphaerae bacterium]
MRGERVFSKRRGSTQRPVVFRRHWGPGSTSAATAFALSAAMLSRSAVSQAEIVSGPDIIAPPASVASCHFGGASNTHQQGFNERQSVVLAADLEVDGGVLIPAGTRVDSHMIFFCWGDSSVHPDLGQVWTFDGQILGVMSDEDGALEAASNATLGAGATSYPGTDTLRGLEGPTYTYPDSYSVSGRTLTLDMTVSDYGDWIRVVTAARDSGVTFSFDYGSASITPPAAATIFTVGSTLAGGLHPASAAPGAPRAVIAGTALGINPGGGGGGCAGPGIRGLDALSYGRDTGSGFRFSVDEWSHGVSGGAAPDVYSEGAVGNQEASADVFTYVAGGNSAYIDGDAIAPFGGVGLGVAEPNPVNGNWQDIADNVDAMDLDTRSSDLAGPIYFSLDGLPAVNDPYEANDNPAGCWTSCAAANGVSGADILRVAAVGAPITVYASAAQLGLNSQTDDVDALALRDDGDGVFEPGIDVVYFSVRRGSAIVGVFDPCSGLNIHEADILTLPCAGFGTPKVHVSHAALGLDVEFDELDALDTFVQIVVGDLNLDELLNNFDIDPFVLALTDPAAYAREYPDGDITRADMNNDGVVNNFDIDRFVECLTVGGCQ